jgi:hypothetical protein
VTAVARTDEGVVAVLTFWIAVVLFVDSDFFASGGTSNTLFFVDANVFFVTSAAGDSSGEGFVASLFVTFPSDARSLRR